MLGTGGFEALINSNRNMKISASMVALLSSFFVSEKADASRMRLTSVPFTLA
jgi:hypothetical protein